MGTKQVPKGNATTARRYSELNDAELQSRFPERGGRVCEAAQLDTIVRVEGAEGFYHAHRKSPDEPRCACNGFALSSASTA